MAVAMAGAVAAVFAVAVAMAVPVAMAGAVVVAVAVTGAVAVFVLRAKHNRGGDLILKFREPMPRAKQNEASTQR